MDNYIIEVENYKELLLIFEYLRKNNINLDNCKFFIYLSKIKNYKDLIFICIYLRKNNINSDNIKVDDF